MTRHSNLVMLMINIRNYNGLNVIKYYESLLIFLNAVQPHKLPLLYYVHT